MPHRTAHLNLIDSSRLLFALDPGAELERADGWLFGAGRFSHPVISNAAFRADDMLDPGELLAQAQAFFAARGRGFALWARTDMAEDRELIAAAEAAGLRNVHEMPEMVLGRRAEVEDSPAGAELSRVTSADDAAGFWQVAAAAYVSNGFPPETFAYYEDYAGLWADNVAAFLARVDGRPAAIAMTIVSHGVAGIYWVGTTEEARGRGLARALTATAVNAGFELGAESASLQASSMGEPVYRRLGFETIFGYRLLMQSAPEGNR
ncbi:MAG: GNAT family N-acetyltransferase [Solirubrobacterales bacterium]